MADKKGVRFWVPAMVNTVGMPPYTKLNGRWNGPFDGQVRGCEFPRILYKGRPLSIQGEMWIDDPNVVRAVVEHPGPVMFDRAEVDAFLNGKPAPVAAPVAEQAPTQPAGVKRPVPELGSMSKKELVQFAGEAAIMVDMRHGKESIQSTIERALRERGEL